MSTGLEPDLAQLSLSQEDEEENETQRDSGKDLERPDHVAPPPPRHGWRSPTEEQLNHNPNLWTDPEFHASFAEYSRRMEAAKDGDAGEEADDAALFACRSCLWISDDEKHFRGRWLMTRTFHPSIPGIPSRRINAAKCIPCQELIKYGRYLKDGKFLDEEGDDDFYLLSIPESQLESQFTPRELRIRGDEEAWGGGIKPEYIMWKHKYQPERFNPYARAALDHPRLYDTLFRNPYFLPMAHATELVKELSESYAVYLRVSFAVLPFRHSFSCVS